MFFRFLFGTLCKKVEKLSTSGFLGAALEDSRTQIESVTVLHVLNILLIHDINTIRISISSSESKSSKQIPVFAKI